MPQDAPTEGNPDTNDLIENETLENPAEVDINECFMNRTDDTGKTFYIIIHYCK